MVFLEVKKGLFYHWCFEVCGWVSELDVGCTPFMICLSIFLNTEDHNGNKPMAFLCILSSTVIQLRLLYIYIFSNKTNKETNQLIS